MCELCLPPMTRRRALGLAGVAVAAVALGRPDPAAASRAFQTEFGVNIEPRETWAGDSRPILDTPPDEDVRFLLVHHTAGPSEGDPIQLIRDVYDFHTGPAKEWPDVAYNYFIEPGGRVFEGRDGSLQRAVRVSATGGNQGYAQLVCLLGDFTNRNPTDAQLTSLNGTLAWLADRFGLDTSPGATQTFSSLGSNKWSQGETVVADTISGHREMSATACPGDTFYPYLKQNVQAQVHALRGNPQAPTAQPVDEAVPETTLVPTAASTTAPAPAPTSVDSTAPAASGPVTTAPPASTSAPTTAVELSTTSAPATTSTVPPTTVPATVAEGPVNTPPAPSVDESAVAAPEPAQATDGRGSSNATAWGVGAGAVSLVAAAAAYVGLRGRGDDAELSTVSGEPLPPPSGGGDPLV